MNKRRKVLSTVAAAALGLTAFIAAPTANASVAPTVTVANCQSALNGQTFSFPTGTSLINIVFTSCAATTPAADSTQATTNPNFVLSNTANPTQPGSTAGGNPSSFSVSGSLSLQESIVSGEARISGLRQGGPGAIVDGTYTVYFGYFTSAPSSVYGSFTLVFGSGGSDPSSSSAAPPQTLELSITPTDGTICRNTSESGTQGTWIDLPAASDCTPPATMPGATLLGWATNPNFPVDIAKRQVDNGWGAYETFNDEGQLTGVFIPAGKPTFLSAAGKIYPIWDM